MIGDKILKLREDNNLSQSDLADLLDVSRQTISKWECGNCEPEVSKIIKLAKIFKVSTDYLLDLDIEDNNYHNSIKNDNVDMKPLMYICISLSIVGVLISFLFCFIAYVLGIISYIISITIPTAILCYKSYINKSDIHKKYLFVILFINVIVFCIIAFILMLSDGNTLLIYLLLTLLMIGISIFNNICKYKYYKILNTILSMIAIFIGILYSFHYTFYYDNGSSSGFGFRTLFDGNVLEYVITILLGLSLLVAYIYSFIKNKSILPTIVSLFVMIIQIIYYAIVDANYSNIEISCSLAVVIIILLIGHLLIQMFIRKKQSLN